MADQSLESRFRASLVALEALRRAVEDGRPWTLATVEPDAPEGGWGPPEILAHIAEMLPFWLGEVERVLEGVAKGVATTSGFAGGEPVPFGRTETDRLRVLTIERDRTLPVRELYGRISVAIDRWAMRASSLTADDLERMGLHPRRGEMRIADMLESFAVGHLEDHVEQLKAAVRRDAEGG